MKKLLSMLANFNAWYDHLNEPKRAIIGLSIGVGPFIVTNIIGSIVDSTPIKAIGFIVLILIICMRIWWMEGTLSKHLKW